MRMFNEEVVIVEIRFHVFSVIPHGGKESRGW